jgi:hypothetical protein
MDKSYNNIQKIGSISTPTTLLGPFERALINLAESLDLTLVFLTTRT